METDGVLIEQSVQGRLDAFVGVVRRHEVTVHGFLARRAGRVAAGDLLGEVWVRAFAALLAGVLGAHLGIGTALWAMTSVLALSAAILLVGPTGHLRDLPAAPAIAVATPAAATI